MARQPKEYTRLAGRGRRREGFKIFVASRAAYTLWMGRDHLLLVERNGYTETYRRFYFSDIQAVIMRRTSRAEVIGWIMGILAFLFMMWGWYVSNAPGKVTLLIIGGFFALCFGINLWLGPTCVTHIQTFVQTEQIPSWCRIRSVRKGLALLRPRLQEAQGAVAGEALKTQWIEAIRTEGQSPSAQGA